MRLNPSGWASRGVTFPCRLKRVAKHDTASIRYHWESYPDIAAIICDFIDEQRKTGDWSGGFFTGE